ncbi:TIGR03619 family F420-dependent LLM class oxidoreductase [Rugosimonospora africana]|uniref:LLM class F420-dependent oxidoreductase n=1 Tax=Rugosimonospora africana TaxID=556532 RepID=A0A8J3VTA2_9ACTN|nr:TIGR03619 family F420-dependent LLM class oxidoreductase [Rugosimonospora africana]GIH17441.1 LLM class F420-dependent oxidoreductase [Rugosimonospora africana]
MQIGFGLPVSGTWAEPGTITRFATEAERLGYHSLWTFTRLLVATDQELEPVYQSVLDPLVALAFAAAHTTRIRLGVAVVNVPYLSPAYLAKQAASLDVLSRGRLDLGLGAGWSAAEFIATGAPAERRGARVEEYVAVLHALWADGVSRHAGEFYTVPAGRMEPKPVQRPGPPVLLGGSAPAALRRAGRIADGWITRSAQDLTRIGEGVAVVREAARRAGRDPAAVRVVCRGVVRLGEKATGAERKPLRGTLAQVRGDIDWLAEQGVTELFFDLNWDPAIGSPDADPVAGAGRAEEILHALAPS